ncbi:MAG: hypothetical protein JSV64_00805, partial [Candidatus Bathyarchaeota archaeon]
WIQEDSTIQEIALAEQKIPLALAKQERLEWQLSDCEEPSAAHADESNAKEAAILIIALSGDITRTIPFFYIQTLDSITNYE